MTTSSSEVIDEEQFSFKQADNKAESEGKTLEQKEQSRQIAKHLVAKEEPPSVKTSVKEFTKIDGKTTSCSKNGIKANARIRVKEDVDLVLKNMKLKIVGQPHYEVIMTTYLRFWHDKENEDRIILKYGLLFRKYFGKTVSVKHYQSFNLNN